MTNIQTADLSKDIPTTIQIRQGAKTALTMSYDFTATGTSMLPAPQKLQSLIDPVVKQWWDGLTRSQRSVVSERGLSLRISAHYRE